MSRLPTPAIDEAPLASREMLRAAAERFGRVPNMVRLLSVSPAALRGYLGLLTALDDGTLGGHPPARLALRHPQLCRCRAFAGIGGLSCDRPVSARLWYDAVPFNRNRTQRSACGARCRCYRPDGCAPDRKGDACGF